MESQAALLEAVSAACPSVQVSITDALRAFQCRSHLTARLDRFRRPKVAERLSPAALAHLFNSDFRTRIPAYGDHPAVAEFSQIRIIDKEELRRNGNGYLVGGIDPDNCWEKRSTGTSGRPVRVVYSAAFYFEQVYLPALKAAAMADLPLIQTSPLHAVRIVDRVEDPHLTLDPNGLGGALLRVGVDTGCADSLRNVVGLIDRFAPAVVSAKPGVFEALAGTDVAPGRAKVQLVISGGAQLADPLRHAIGKFFRAPVSSIYGMTEFGAFAFECRSHRFHLDGTAYHAEILPAAAGAGGSEIVVSSLLNSAMPLLRYRTGDEGELGDGPCPCGRIGTTISSLIGRIAPAFAFRSGMHYSPGQYFRGIFAMFPEVREYQVNQLDPGRIELLLEATGEEPELPDRVLAWLRPALPVDLEVTCRQTEFSDPGKFQRYRVLS